MFDPRVVGHAVLALVLGFCPAAFAAQAIPATMRGVVIDQPGGPEVLQVRTLPVPRPCTDSASSISVVELSSIENAGVSASGKSTSPAGADTSPNCVPRGNCSYKKRRQDSFLLRAEKTGGLCPGIHL